MADRTTVVVFMVTALSIGGFVNYRRNAPLEAGSDTRIYADLTIADLNALIRSYEDDLRELRSWAAENPNTDRVAREKRPGGPAQDSQSSERYRTEANRWKTRQQVLADHERMIKQLRHERSLREEGLDQSWYRIMRRMTRL